MIKTLIMDQFPSPDKAFREQINVVLTKASCEVNIDLPEHLVASPLYDVCNKDRE